MKPHLSCKSFFMVLVSMVVLGQSAGGDSIIHESATLGFTGVWGGWSLNSTQMIGSRFHIDQYVEVTKIGGHMAVNRGDFFGAIISLSSFGSLPQGSPFTASEVVASVVFIPCSPSCDYRTALSVVLPPGNYALVFGSDYLGASGGSGWMADLLQENLPGASYFFWDGSAWHNTNPYPPPRLVVEGITEVTISGYIRTSDSTAIEGVLVSADNGGSSDTTDASGYYELTVPYNWSGTVTPTKTYWIFYPESRSYSNVVTDESGQDYTGAELIQISGRVADVNGIAMEGVQLSANNGGGQDITDANGYYDFYLPPGWSGTVTPAKSGWGFDPESRTYSNVITDQANQDYTAFQPKISGHITDVNAIGIDGIVVSADNGGGSDTTDANGYYEIVVPYGWSGTITPNAPPDWGFIPANHSYSNITADQTNQDYRIFQPKISGYVTDANGIGIDNIVVSADSERGSDTSDVNGFYEIVVPYGWSGTVTPNAPPDWGFVPVNRSYSNITADQTNQDFVIFQPIISGYIKDAGGIAIEGVTVSADNGAASDTTDSYGYYEIVVVYGWSGTVVPTKTGLGFVPFRRIYNSVILEQINQDYLAHVPQTFVVRADGTGDYPTIQAAIDASLNGDTIIVEDGIYTGSGNRDIDFKGKAITLLSQNGPENCVIDCENAVGHRGFYFHSGEGPGSLISGLTIRGGNKIARGGGIDCVSASPTIENCIITANKTYGHSISMDGGSACGGGICCRSGSSALIVGCTISNNLAQGGNGKPLEGYDVPWNGGPGLGGGIFCDSVSNVIIFDCLFKGNQAKGGRGYPGWGCAGAGGYAYGGGLYCDSATAIIVERCVFQNNSAAGSNSGSGDYCGSSSKAGNGYGGGIYSTQDSVILRNCSVVGNTATGGQGPSIYADGVGYGAGVYGGAQITGCTLVSNSAEHRGGGVYGSARVTNSILWSNNAPSYAQIGPSSGPLVTYSDVKDGFAGEGNIDANPMFEGAIGGVYHIFASSPCRDGGDPNYIAEPEETDIDNEPRIWRGRIDMGADEFFRQVPYIFPAPLGFEFEASVAKPVPPAQQLSIRNLGSQTLKWQISTDCSWLTADPNAGTCDAEADQVVLNVDASALNLGFHDCNLIITDPCAENSPQTLYVSVELFSEGRVYVPSEFPTIQEAIDVTIDGAEVIIEPGTYTGAGNNNIDFGGKAITVRSTEPNNPAIVASTIIVGHGFYFHSGEGADSVVDGLTITEGYSGIGGGITCRDSSPTIRNCTIRDCFATSDGGGIGLEDSNATIINCIITDNSTTETGGGIACLFSGNPSIINCLITGNSVVWTGGGIASSGCNVAIGNCTLVGNKAKHRYNNTGWGGALSIVGIANISNCILWSNDANDGPEIAVLRINQPSTATVSYCDVEGGEAAVYIEPGCTFNWDNAGNMDTDPCFAQPGYWKPVPPGPPPPPPPPGPPPPPPPSDDYWVNGDYHLMSTSGRWKSSIYLGLNPTGDRFINLLDFAAFSHSWQQEGGSIPADLDRSGIVDSFDLKLVLDNYLSSYQLGQWVTDEVMSPCIDSGNPHSDWTEELWPHGRRINMGAYGGSAEASMSFSDAGNIADLVIDDYGCICYIDMKQLTDQWLYEEAPLSGDLDRNGIVNFTDYAIFTHNMALQPGLPGLQASNPYPSDGAGISTLDADLSWTTGPYLISHDVYFGTSNPPPFIGNQTATTFDPGTMTTGTTYYWRIDEVSDYCTIEGRVWSFTIMTGPPL